MLEVLLKNYKIIIWIGTLTLNCVGYYKQKHEVDLITFDIFGTPSPIEEFIEL